jgi:predicted Zn-dependent peptidase
VASAANRDQPFARIKARDIKLVLGHPVFNQFMMRFLLALSLAATLPANASAQSLTEFQKKVTEFTLANGFHFIVVERHDAPVVSFNTYVNAGSVDDPSGQTGIAHMFEHMAFKGTSTIGTANWGIERQRLKDIEKAYDTLEAERNKGSRGNPVTLEHLVNRLKTEVDLGQEYANPSLFTQLIEENGGSDLNAQTSPDSTVFYYSLPSNRAELWFLLESQRFYDPVFREFYKERDVVLEERRMSTESNPEALLRESFSAAAFEAHPYHNPPGGWLSDIENFRLRDALAFYRKYYAPANIVFGIVGDINPAAARRWAEKYFLMIPPGPPPAPIHTVEPKQLGERRVAVESDAQPVEFVGYKRPSETSPDDPVLEVIGAILSGGRTGTIYKDLVRDKKVALSAGAVSSFPGGKYSNLFMLYVYPNLGKSLDECEKSLFETVERLKTEKVDEATLKRIRAQLRESLMGRLETNESLASEVTSYHAAYGDWRKLFTELQDFDRVTADDVERVAKRYFVGEARTVARIIPVSTNRAPAPPSEPEKTSAAGVN